MYVKALSLMFFALMSAGVAQAETTYIKLVCGAQDSHRSPVFSGYMITEKNSIQYRNDGFSLNAKRLNKNQKLMTKPACRDWYLNSEQVMDGLDVVWRKVQKKRSWNVLEVTPVSSSVHLNCSVDSYLEIFDTKTAWYADMSRGLVDSESFAGVSRGECILDAVP